MKKQPLIYIEHIYESIQNIEEFMENLSEEDLRSKKLYQNAIVRELEIIGEATKNIHSGFTNKYPNVPWSEIAKTRDKLIHYYFEVDLKILWDIIHVDIPSLKKQIIEILKQEKK
ncbi:DUF86 domain-containing protein [Candidatus Woesearchaeota archaeon]|nr:DUF86 domain-containing protein [Candidatus Woesearchaeota archaeon]